MTIYDVPINELILKAAEELKKIKEIMPPSWADFVKTGMHKERPPVQKDWWYIRAASVLNAINKLGPVGVSKLRTKYGGKKNRGYRPEKFFKGSGNILRKILQQLEKAGFAAKADKGIHKGRIITPAGLALLGKVAAAIMIEKKIIIPKKSTEELKVETPRKKNAKKVAKQVTRKRRSKKTEEGAAEGEAKAAKPARKRRSKKTEEAPAEIPAAPVEAPKEEAPAEETVGQAPAEETEESEE